MNVNELFSAFELEKIQNTLKVSDKCVPSGANEEELGKHTSLQKKGLNLISSGKTAVVLVVNDEGWYSDLDIVCDNAEHPTSSSLPDLLGDDRRFAKVVFFFLAHDYYKNSIRSLFTVIQCALVMLKKMVLACGLLRSDFNFQFRIYFLK